MKKASRQQQKHENYPVCKELNSAVTWAFFPSKASVTTLLSASEYCVHVLLSPSYSHLYSTLLIRAFLDGPALSPLDSAFVFPPESTWRYNAWFSLTRYIES